MSSSTEIVVRWLEFYPEHDDERVYGPSGEIYIDQYRPRDASHFWVNITIVYGLKDSIDENLLQVTCTSYSRFAESAAAEQFAEVLAGHGFVFMHNWDETAFRCYIERFFRQTRGLAAEEQYAAVEVLGPSELMHIYAGDEYPMLPLGHETEDYLEWLAEDRG